MPTTSARSHGPVPLRAPAALRTPTHLALEKVIQDHIPTVSTHLVQLLSLLLEPPPASPALRRLCQQAQDGVRRMDAELRTIEAGWDTVDKERWEICRRDYKSVMKLVQMVWEAGQGRMEELRSIRERSERMKKARSIAA